MRYIHLSSGISFRSHMNGFGNVFYALRPVYSSRYRLQIATRSQKRQITHYQMKEIEVNLCISMRSVKCIQSKQSVRLFFFSFFNSFIKQIDDFIVQSNVIDLMQSHIKAIIINQLNFPTSTVFTFLVAFFFDTHDY